MDYDAIGLLYITGVRSLFLDVLKSVLEISLFYRSISPSSTSVRSGGTGMYWKERSNLFRNHPANIDGSHLTAFPPPRYKIWTMWTTLTLRMPAPHLLPHIGEGVERPACCIEFFKSRHRTIVHLYSNVLCTGVV